MEKEKHTVLCIENKIDYGRLQIEMPNKIAFNIYKNETIYPTIWLKPKAGTIDITIITYGSGLHSALETVDELFFEYEMIAQIICMTKIYPLSIESIRNIINTNQLVVTVEEGSIEGGFGSEVISTMAEQSQFSGCSFARVGSENVPIPTVKSLEHQVLINKNKILTAIEKLI